MYVVLVSVIIYLLAFWNCWISVDYASPLGKHLQFLHLQAESVKTNELIVN